MNKNTTPQKFGANYIGCVVDGSASSADYINERTIDFAKQFGFECEDLPDEDNEDYSQILSEEGDNAVSFLNEQDNLPYCSWYFDDNSLFYSPSIESASEDVGFKSVKSLSDAQRMGIETDEEDSSYPPKDYEGEWLHVSDHGNATLYVRQAGEDTEIWGVV